MTSVVVSKSSVTLDCEASKETSVKTMGKQWVNLGQRKVWEIAWYALCYVSSVYDYSRLHVHIEHIILYLLMACCYMFLKRSFISNS